MATASGSFPLTTTESLPIDIHYNKLLDWLINRRHCNPEWPKSAASIREKVNKAIQDMPPVQEITTLLEGTYINYFHCQRILELLKETDSGKKNIFGQYSSQKMKDWVEINKLYEKDGIYLAETAQMIARNVNYEIPALKKQIAKCQQIHKECCRKEADYASKSSELRKQYEAKCKQMGIEGKKIKSELSALVSDLPSTFNRIAESTQNIQDAVEFYGEFINFIMNSQEFSDSSLPMLKYIHSHGNVTTYEWRVGHKPDIIDNTAVVIDTSDEQDTTGEADAIDWGDLGNGDTEADNLGEIDFGDLDLSEITVEQGGAENQETSDTAVVEPEEESNGIDWSDTVLVEHPDTGGVAKGSDALTILDNPKTRVKFMDDLMELEAFLTQRICEMESVSGADVISTSQFQNAPASLQLEKSSVVAMVTKVKDILCQLTSVKMHHLMLIRNSPRYVDRLRDSLKQTLTLADKMVFYEKEMVVRQKEALEEQRQIEPKLDVIIQKTKEMQKQMEAEISKKYKDRKVNIMGEINVI